MAWFGNLKIFHKISLIIILTIAAFAAIIVINASSQKLTQQDLAFLESKVYPIVQLATVNEVLLEKADDLFTQSVSFGDEELKAQAVAALAKLKSNLQRVQSLDSKNAAVIRKHLSLVTDYQTQSLEIVDGMLAETIDFSALPAKTRTKSETLEKTQEGLKQYKQSIDQLLKETIEQARSSGENALQSTIFFGVVMIVIVALIAIYVARSISTTVSELRDSLAELASGKGELSHRLQVRNKDELGQLATNFNRFIDTLSQSISDVMGVSHPLLDTSTRLISNTEQARTLTSQQAANAAQTQQSMTELNQSIEGISESAGLANSAANEAEVEANNGLTVVEATIENSKKLNEQIDTTSKSIHRLAQDTDSVSSILDVINAIAEQTNLLALNAAIEAARAGEQGRGFAVVADEVRTLASRTGDATTEIRDLLDKLRNAASESVTMMGQAETLSSSNEEFAIKTGSALEQIKGSVENISMMNNQIATATEEQSVVANHVVDIINTMSETEQQIQGTFSSLEEVSHQLHQASDDLMEATSQFKL
ncbi:methyl-accepting chemotaxis protein [Saccharobesus litoralis]|uniref:Methyl-accepting chemotaxis protein n=1 Tax=Saccharobesus litoralis TaxID=2172099 RepID=A0A2S0VRX7_9ALTE|nr:methyl-accepting chemotaxis protein [Saccharobesus litoralis]AWB66975.1 methyl-accepting chemotaxis protein [Saccharobesus litoralis]